MEDQQTKSILVTYLERNKVLKIPSLDANTTKVSDIILLMDDFKKEFKFDCNVRLEITFQRFDSEWGEYVDLDEGSTLEHKDKLNAVVTPMLTTPSSSVLVETSEASTPLLSTAGPSSSKGFIKPRQIIFSGSESEEPNSPCSSPPGEAVMVSSRKHLPESFDQQIKDYSSAMVSVKKQPKFFKTEDDHTPLPDPFPLPKHFRADVETALATGKMTRETTSSFLSSIAAAMLVHKRYPTKEDYVCVARSVLQKYTFMSSPVGTPYGAIVTSLRNRFKEFRRKPVKRSKLDVGSKKSPKKRRPGITQSPSEPFSPPQEDDAVSFDRHNRVLIAEFKKNRRNSQVVSELMERTFQLRRKSILEESSDLKEVFKRFPFLQESDQLMKELERVAGQKGLTELARSTWKEMVPKILEQARLESHRQSVDLALKTIIDIGNPELAALIVLTALLPDSRARVDTGRVMHLDQGSSVEDIVVNAARVEPYVAVCGEDLKAYLVVDKQVIDRVNIENLPITLLSAFFVYNICYPKGCVNFYTFLEITMLHYSAEKAPASIKHLLTQICH